MNKINCFTKKGFTLIELIVTVILVAILASYAVYHYTSTIREGEVKAARGKLAALGGAVERFKIEHGLPNNLEEKYVISDFSTACDYQSSTPATKLMSIFSCGDVERSLGYDQHFTFYFGKPSNGTCGGNLDEFTVFMVPKDNTVAEYPKCAFFNPNTDSTVEVE